MNKPPTVLAVFAHPDDEAWVCGGTLAALSSRGVRTVLVTFTRGEKSTQIGSPKLTARVLAARRLRELRHSASILGIRTIHALKYPDGGLDRVKPSRLDEILQYYLNRYKPAAVFTFARDGLTGHSDHQVVARLVRRIRRQLSTGLRAKCDFVFFSYPNTVRRRLNIQLIEQRQRLRRVDTRQFVEKKLRAIFCHQSQVLTLARIQRYDPDALRKLFSYEYVALYYRHGKKIAPDIVGLI
ncbi:MAG: PIG-L family deacetylase [Candidatus Kerfeldbacteria bacterium]|nr:PIG-L family deacetylase [Candidatus Kerfeldbacteria bacterium]